MRRITGETASKRVNKAPGTEHPLLIYPRNTKYELAFAQPYLEMISSFQSSIRERDTGWTPRRTFGLAACGVI